MEMKVLKISFSKMAYNVVQNMCNCFSLEVIADVTKMNPYVNKCFSYIPNMPNFFNYSVVI